MNRRETIEKPEQIYLIGIGGIGMSALARYFIKQGKQVAGYDRVSTRLTDDLMREGSEIHFTADLSYIQSRYPDPQKVLVIYTPAIPQDHPELAFFRKGGYQVLKRAEVLGVLSAEERCIAIAGTHGKTTVSAMITHLLKTAGIPCNAFLGGISLNYGSNAVLNGQDAWMVVEADEFDRSFLHLRPDLAVLTSCDPDHLDIYGNRQSMEEAFCTFIDQVKSGGLVIHHASVHLPCLKGVDQERRTYQLSGTKGIYCRQLRIQKGIFHFDVVSPGDTVRGFQMQTAGRINIENALAALAVGMFLGIRADILKRALATYRGVKRRFEIIIQREDLVYIDDYAHHPSELEACIRSIRELYPGREVTGIFQPHLYSRTRDFAEGFAESLSMLDRLILLEIYPAREEPIEGVSSAMIFEKVRLEDKLLIRKEQLIQVLEEITPEVLLTLGAGDIDQWVEPISNHYHSRNG